MGAKELVHVTLTKSRLSRLTFPPLSVPRTCVAVLHCHCFNLLRPSSWLQTYGHTDNPPRCGATTALRFTRVSRVTMSPVPPFVMFSQPRKYDIPDAEGNRDFGHAPGGPQRLCSGGAVFRGSQRYAVAAASATSVLLRQVGWVIFCVSIPETLHLSERAWRVMNQWSGYQRVPTVVARLFFLFGI